MTPSVRKGETCLGRGCWLGQVRLGWVDINALLGFEPKPEHQLKPKPVSVEHYYLHWGECRGWQWDGHQPHCQPQHWPQPQPRYYRLGMANRLIWQNDVWGNDLYNETVFGEMSHMAK